MTQQDNILTASEGKVLRRIADQAVYGKEIALGYSYYIGGIKLDEPHLDTADDFEEIDEPTDEATEQIKEETASQTLANKEEEDAALLKFVNRKTGNDYTDLGEAIKELVIK